MWQSHRSFSCSRSLTWLHHVCDLTPCQCWRALQRATATGSPGDALAKDETLDRLREGSYSEGVDDSTGKDAWETAGAAGTGRESLAR